MARAQPVRDDAGMTVAGSMAVGERREHDADGGGAPAVGWASMRPSNLVRHLVEVHTVTLRAYGTLHARAGVAMTRILNASDRPHLSLTDAHLYAKGVEQPPAPHTRLYSSAFAAIPKDAVMWLVGGLAEEYQPSLRLEPRDTFLVYPTFVLAGAIHMRPEVRFSDAIGSAMINKPYVTLHEARVLDRREADTPILELPPLRQLEHVTVDLRKATAILDRDGSTTPDLVLTSEDQELISDIDVDVDLDGDVDLDVDVGDAEHAPEPGAE